MSEHQRGAWGGREDVWWTTATGGIVTQDQHTLQQHHLINQHQHHQQQLAAHQQAQLQQQQHQVVQQSHQVQNDVARSNSTTSGVPTQQLFSYKMASSFQNPSTTMAGGTVPSSNVGAYDYRLNMPTAAVAAPPGTQWWYPQGQNIEQMQQQHQQNQQQSHQQQNIHVVHIPPPTVCF